MEKNILIRPVLSRKDRHQFILFPWNLYSSWPNWVPPLIDEEKKRITKNPFFKHGEAQFWLAYKEGKPAGRISAQIDFLYNDHYKEKTGHFGFFESINDPIIASQLIQTAENWLKEKGMNRVTGPFSLNINEESGLMIKGFEEPVYPFMPLHLPYYENFFLSAGYSKIKDLYAWDCDARGPIPDLVSEIANQVRPYPGLVIRQINLGSIEKDIRIIADVFNSAMGKNWGFVPWTEEQINLMAKEFKLILEPKLALIAEVDGKPAAISISIPNYCEVISDLGGKLFPWGWLKLLYRVKTKKIKSTRVCLLGVKKEYRGSVLGGLSVLLYAEMYKAAQELNHRGAELSWTLEDNEKMNAGVQMMGGVHYKTYRIFEKFL